MHMTQMTATTKIMMIKKNIITKKISTITNNVMAKTRLLNQEQNNKQIQKYKQNSKPCIKNKKEDTLIISYEMKIIAMKIIIFIITHASTINKATIQMKKEHKILIKCGIIFIINVMKAC